VSAPCCAVPVPRLLLALLAVLVGAAPAAALEIRLDRPRERAGYVYVDARLRDLFPPRIAESLARGMPATLLVRTELWRGRNGWFDRLESSFDASIRIRYEVWNESYRLERAGVTIAASTDLDSIAAVLSRPWALPAGRVGDLRPEPSYYVVVYGTLKPLTVEDVQEVEGWLSGEVRNERTAGLGVITELPRSLFDAVRNFAGFGDQRARAVSRHFALRDLFPEAP
jgi:uncharacterized protein DUF4390